MTRTLRRLAGACVGLAVVGVVVVVVVELAVTGTAKPRMYSVDDVPSRPVALVLGAEVYPDGSPSPFLKGRLDVAVDLWQQDKVRAILVSGDNGHESYNEPDGMREYLIDHGVPANKVVADYAGFDTYDSCFRAKEIFGVHHVTMVTQEYHLPRAVATCNMVGLEAVGVGDTSVKPDSRTWYYGEIREMAANMKMVWDVITRREPTLGPPEDGIQRALSS